MRRLLVLLLLLATPASAQFSQRLTQELNKMLSPAGWLRAPLYVTAGLPPCTGVNNQGQFAYDDTLNSFVYCDGTGWVAPGGGGGGVTWPLLAPNGTAAAPSYSFTAGPSAGIYYTGSSPVFKGPDGSGADVAGGPLTVVAGIGTGTGVGGNVGLYAYPPGVVSSSTLNAIPSGVFISGVNGAIQIGGANLPGAVSTHQFIGLGRVGTDLVGGGVSIIGGRGTGTGNGGSVSITVATPSVTSGTTLNTSQTIANFVGSSGGIVLGGVDSATSMGTVSLAGVHRRAGVVDGAAGLVQFFGGKSTGTGGPGSIVFYMSPASTVSGSTQNAHQAAFTLAGNGYYTLGGVDFVGTPTTSNVVGVNRAAGVTDGVGAGVSIIGGKGTGTAAGGSVVIQVAPPAATTGTTQNAAQTAVTFSGTSGAVTIGGVNIVGTPGTSTISGADRAAGVTDSAGGILDIEAGQGTGTGAPGALRFLAARRATSTGTAQNAYVQFFAADDLSWHLGGSTAIAQFTSNAPAASSLQAYGGVGTDIAGGTLQLIAGRSTGTGLGGRITMRMAARSTVSSATANTLRNVEQWDIDTVGTLQSTDITATAPDGGTMVRRAYSELLTLSTVGATTDTTANLLPAGAIILSVTTRVTTTITGGGTTQFSVGDATTSARFSAMATGTAAASVRVGLQHQQGSVATDAAGPVQTAAAPVRITCNGTPTAGVVRVHVWALVFTAPTS